MSLTTWPMLRNSPPSSLNHHNTMADPVAQVVDLPVRTDIDNARMTGSLKEMLTLAKLSKDDEGAAPEPSPEPQATTPPEPAPSTPPAEQDSEALRIAKAEESLRTKLFQHKKKKAEPKEPAPEPPAEPPVAQAPPEPAPAPAPAPAKAPAKKVAVKDPAADYAERLERLEQERLRLEREKLEFEKSRQPQPPTPTAQPKAMSLMSDDERYEYDVFGEMDKLEPGKDYQKKFLRSVEAAAVYKADWEKKNDGEAFDPNDSAHDAFYAKNNMSYDRRTFRRAEAALATPERKEDPETQRQLNELKLKAVMNEVQPRAMRTAAVTIQAMLENIDSDVAKLVSEGGGQKALLEQYPAKGPQIMRVAATVKNFSDEAFKLLETDGLVAPDLDRNNYHRIILNIISKQEPLISAQSQADKTLPDGRTFVTWERWAALSPEQRTQHWHLGAEEVVDIFSQVEAERIKDEFVAIDKEIETRSKRNGHVAPAPAPAAPAPAPRPSPAVSSRSVIDTTNTKGPDTSTQLDKKLRSILFRKAS